MAISCKILAGWYSQMGTALEAGIPLVTALERFRGPKQEWRRAFANAIKAGRPFEEILERTRWLPPADRPALAVGARSGRLPEIFRLLSQKHEILDQQGRRVRAATLYPLFVVHFAALIVPVRELIFGNPAAYIGAAATILVPLWAVLIAVRLALRQPRVRGWLLRCLPMWRGFWRNETMADFCFTLKAELAAGVNAAQAWRDAGDMTENPALAKAARRIGDMVERQGRLPGELIEKYRVFPEDFIQFYQSGEMSGKLTENLDYLSESFRQNAFGALSSAAVIYSTFPIIIVAVAVGYYVISFYVDYFSQIGDVIGF